MKNKYLITISVLFGLLATFFAKDLYLQDFTIYWKATENFVQGENAYDLPNQNTYIEGNIGILDRKAFTLKMWAPPTVFGVTLPFGFLNQYNAKRLYLFLLISSLVFLTLFYKKKYLSKNSVSLSFVYKVIPISPIVFMTIEIIRSGGVNWIALIGVASSLLLFEKSLFFLGALALYPILIKTQTFLLFIYLLLLFAIKEKKYEIIYGLVLIIILNTLLVITINAKSFEDYLNLDTSSLESGFIFSTASLGKVLNLLFHTKNLIVSYLPLTLGAVFLPAIVFKATKNLSLNEIILILMPICLTFSPYIWVHDYIVCTPSIFYFASQIGNKNTFKEYTKYLRIIFFTYIILCMPHIRFPIFFHSSSCDIASEIVLSFFALLLLYAKIKTPYKVTS